MTLDDVMKDCKIEVYPNRPLGGQHVGTDNGVKVTHEPSGIVAIVNSGRSQHTNRTIAMDMIMAAITHPKFK